MTVTNRILPGSGEVSSHTTEPNEIGPADLVAVSRRRFVIGASSMMALTALPEVAFAKTTSATRIPPAVLSGNTFDLHIGKQQVNFTGAERVATTVNGTLPGPILCWKEGDRVTLGHGSW